MMLRCFGLTIRSELYQFLFRNTTQPAMKLTVTLLAIASLASTVSSQSPEFLATDEEMEICRSNVRSQRSTSYYKQARTQLS